MSHSNLPFPIGHEVLEQIKITLTIDGDTAATISNLIIDAARTGKMNDLVFCGHTGPKITKLLELITGELDIANKVEK